MRILLTGYGRMGRMIEELSLAAGHEVVGRIDADNIAALAQARADVIMDFSSPSMLASLAPYIQATGTALVSGTTGYTPEHEAAFQALGAFAPVLHSANFSLGVAVFRRLLGVLSQTPLMDFDVEITETHHNQKADAPSGTALALLRALDPDGKLTPVYGRQGQCGKRGAKEVGIHALRGGTVAGEHTVAFFGPDEVLEITHKAASRRIFAAGALRAAEALYQKPRGFYTLEQILFGDQRA